MVITGRGGGLQHPDMKLALSLGFLAFTLLAVLLVWSRARLEMVRSRLRRAEEDAIDLGLDTRAEA
jgi:heme exporter protein C